MSNNDGAGFQIDPHGKPYTHLNFKNDPDEFHFALLSDNAGGPRPGVVGYGLKMLNLLHPEFVVNLGDLVEGYTNPEGGPAEEDEYLDWWAEFDEYVSVLEMPFFYLPGNHDINNPPSVKVWHDRLGGDRRYYHFRYKDTLFLIIDTEDPPKDTDALFESDPELAAEIGAAYEKILQAAAEGASGETLLELAGPIEEYFGVINISDEQVEYFNAVIDDNRDVRWTFVLMHAPAWWSPSGGERDPGNFANIEELLEDRQYTVFAAHVHTYDYAERYGRDYITTAMTGALNVPRPAAIDHIVWITMTKDGPKIANLLLNGMLDKYGPVDDDLTIKFGMYSPPEDASS